MTTKLEQSESRLTKYLANDLLSSAGCLYYVQYNGLFVTQHKTIDRWLDHVAKLTGKTHLVLRWYKGAAKALIEICCPHYRINVNPKNEKNLIEVIHNHFPNAKLKTVYFAASARKKLVARDQEEEGNNLLFRAANGEIGQTEVEEINSKLKKNQEMTLEEAETETTQERSITTETKQSAAERTITIEEIKAAVEGTKFTAQQLIKVLKRLNFTITK